MEIRVFYHEGLKKSSADCEQSDGFVLITVFMFVTHSSDALQIITGISFLNRSRS